MKQKNSLIRPLSFIGILLLVTSNGCGAQTEKTVAVPGEDVKDVPNVIRTEALRSNDDPKGRALPLIATWNTGHYSFSYPGRPRGFDPAYQINKIEEGHHIMLSLVFPAIDGGEEALKKFEEYYKGPLQKAAQLNLPITLVGTQWERRLLSEEEYFSLPAERNPNVVTPEGKIEKKLSPFGPVDLWQEVGEKWVSSPLMKKLQEWYPDPPQVIFLSNNETSKLRWHEIESDRRYIEEYGQDRDDDFKRKIIGDGFIERFRAMQESMKAELSPAWQTKVLFTGYSAFGTSALGRWGGWINYSQHTPGRFDPNPLMWDGTTPSYYTDNWNSSTDFRVMSPQIESMNWVFMQNEAIKLNPDFRFSFSIWDGHNGKDDDKRAYYEKLGQTYNPTRYAGYAQFGLWLLRPRILREYRGWTESLEDSESYYMALVDSIDKIYKNDTLQGFWRQGKLVANHAYKHPYQSKVPDEYQDADRWFLLDTNLDPDRPWKLDTEIPVLSLSLVKGDKGDRHWLVYAHSPVRDRSKVRISIPEYGEIIVDVPVAGAFYLVNEKTEQITNINL